MPTEDRATRIFRSPIVVAAIVVTVSLAGVTEPSHADTDIFGTSRRAGKVTSGRPIVTLTVAGGKYAIFAKINLDQDDSSSPAGITCDLLADDLDRSRVTLQSSGIRRLDNAVIPFQVVQEFSERFMTDLTITCSFPKGDSSLLSFRSARIMALRIEGALCEEDSVATCP